MGGGGYGWAAAWSVDEASEGASPPKLLGYGEGNPVCCGKSEPARSIKLVVSKRRLGKVREESKEKGKGPKIKGRGGRGDEGGEWENGVDVKSR